MLLLLGNCVELESTTARSFNYVQTCDALILRLRWLFSGLHSVRSTTFKPLMQPVWLGSLGSVTTLRARIYHPSLSQRSLLHVKLNNTAAECGQFNRWNTRVVLSWQLETRHQHWPFFTSGTYPPSWKWDIFNRDIIAMFDYQMPLHGMIQLDEWFPLSNRDNWGSFHCHVWLPKATIWLWRTVCRRKIQHAINFGKPSCSPSISIWSIYFPWLALWMS